MFVFVFYLIHFDIKQSFNIFVLIIYNEIREKLFRSLVFVPASNVYVAVKKVKVVICLLNLIPLSVGPSFAIFKIYTLSFRKTDAGSSPIKMKK